LVLFAHPECPCTRASLAELARLLARFEDRLTADVVFLRPSDVGAAWDGSDLWRTASAMPGVTAVRDDDGVEAVRFRATTSGAAVLYDARGRLLFRGGLTSARGPRRRQRRPPAHQLAASHGPGGPLRRTRVRMLPGPRSALRAGQPKGDAMTMDDRVDQAAQAIVGRAEERFQAHWMEIVSWTDRLFAKLMVGQWLFAIVIALVVSPYAWEGRVRTVHAHVWFAIFLGGAISVFPIALAVRRAGWVVTRHVIAGAQMLWSALLIHLTGGRIETHFHVFGSLGILAFYRDWTVLATATVVVASEHLIRGLVWPESVYGVANPEWWRFLEHAFWVIFSVVFLAMSCLRALKEMRLMAERGAHIEALSEAEWRRSSVLERVAKVSA
jgi:hypothetical protein